MPPAPNPLARIPPPWQDGGMSSRPPSPAAGGPLIAIGALVGVAIGFAIGQATPGFLIGLGVGIAAATLLWWRNR